MIEVAVNQQYAEMLADLRAPHFPPMITEYDWLASFDPFPHQYKMAGLMSSHKRFFCLADPGTGKTVSVVWAFDYLKSIGRVKKILIVAPLSLLEDTWAKEFRNGMPHGKYVILHGNAAKRKQLAKQPHDIAIINYDGVEIVYDELAANKYDLIVFDESTMLKNINRRWKFNAALAKHAEWVWALTGTPTAQAPTDAYGQCKLLLNESFTYSEGAWKDAVMRQLTKFKWVPKPEAAQIVQHWMQPSIYIRKRDVLKDLPPLTRNRRKVEVSPEQKKMLDTLRKDAMAVSASGSMITAVHAAALNLKLLQCASGSVYDETGGVVELDNTPRITELLAVIKETRQLEDFEDDRPNNKVLVLCMFKHTVASVLLALKAAGFDAVSVTGDTPIGQRNAIFSAFQNTRGTEVIVAIPDVLAHGLTLTAASTTVWFTPITSAEKFTQAANRTDRPGQKYPMQMVELYGTEAEKLLYNRLDEREQHQKDVLSAYDEIVSFL
jgi:SNF2 family DNA or RNA helicase